MCRLYGFRATEPTKIECTLVHAQNALLVQSYRDHSGTSHLNGWGLALYQDGRLQTMRQAKAAVDDSDFRRVAGRAYSQTVLAHVRRATVGRVALENTHPFCYGRWAFVHNGTLTRFDELRPKMLAMMTPKHRAAIQGETDSEHIFHMLLSAHESAPARPLGEILRPVLGQIGAWYQQIDSAARIGLNILLTERFSAHPPRPTAQLPCNRDRLRADFERTLARDTRTVDFRRLGGNGSADRSASAAD